MNNIFLDILKCPQCNSSIECNMIDYIECSNSQCNNHYLIKENVPTFISMTPDSGIGFEYQWEKRFRGKFELDTLYGKGKSEEYSQFFRHLKIDPHKINNMNILDAGCGSTRMLQLLAEKHSANYFGIDLSSSLYNHTSIETINLVRGDLLELPFKDDSFDYIWSGGVLHHTGYPEKAFKQLVGALKPEGKIYIWLYSIDQGIFGRMRKLLPRIYKISHPLLYYFCGFFACPIYLGGMLFNKYHSFSEIRFKLFDHLSPKYRSVHTENEVIHWFEENNLINIEVIINQETGGVGILGEKA